MTQKSKQINELYETQPVAAANNSRARGRDIVRGTPRTHAVDLATGEALCRRVKAASLLEGSLTEEEAAAPATCPACAKRDPRFVAGAKVKKTERFWLGDAALEAMALPDPQMEREMGMTDLVYRDRKAGGSWVDGPEDQLRKLAYECGERADMNGGEGFGDGLAAINSLRSVQRRGLKLFGPYVRPSRGGAA